MPKQRIALFGGTFDPIHLGHTAVAAYAGKYVCADRTIFVPAKRSPLKSFSPLSGDRDRLNMIRLAIADRRDFEVSDYEIRKAKLSYTLHTVRYFRRKLGKDAVIYWFVGADSVNELLCWYKIEDLIKDCRLCIMYRAGYNTPDFAGFEKALPPLLADKLRHDVIPTPLVDISSTEVRRRLAAGEDVSAMLSPAVAEYIRQHNLYLRS